MKEILTGRAEILICVREVRRLHPESEFATGRSDGQTLTFGGGSDSGFGPSPFGRSLPRGMPKSQFGNRWKWKSG